MNDQVTNGIVKADSEVQGSKATNFFKVTPEIAMAAFTALDEELVSNFLFCDSTNPRDWKQAISELIAWEIEIYKYHTNPRTKPTEEDDHLTEFWK